MKWSGSWQTLDSDWSDCNYNEYTRGLLPVPSWTQWVGSIYHICARFWQIFTLQLGIIKMKPSRIQVDIRYLFFKNTSRLTVDFPVAIWLWTTGRWDQQLWSARADWCRFSIVGCEEREPWQMIWWSKTPNHDFEPMPFVHVYNSHCMKWYGDLMRFAKNERQRYRRIWSLTQHSAEFCFLIRFLHGFPGLSI